MKIMTYKNISPDQTIGSKKPMVLGLLIAAVLSLCACSMPSPTNNGSSGGGIPSTGGGVPNPGGGVPNPGGGAPSPGGDPGGNTASPDGGDAGDSGSSSGESSGSGESGDSIEGLDEALDESLEDFDETVLSEGNRGNDNIDILSPSGTSGGIDSDEPLFEEAGDGVAEGNPSIEQRAAEGAPPGADGNGAEAPAGQAANSSGPQQADNEIIPIPDDIDDGQGDDIVLRQIRDAASREQDPVLREKLWDEYRRIKGQG
jgi:hypothetical protein